ncbi:MAG: SDR family NAD(P)-dependent oxidoreductase [Thermoplasmatota archaeon]
MASATVTRHPIAIIGLGCVLPDAPDVPTFWDNVLAGKNSIREVPKERWDPELYWDADKGAPDKTYAKIGAFVTDDGFNGLDFRMPPKVVEHIDPSQRWALSAAKEALEDAGYATGLRGDEGRPFDRSRCAVILGNAMGGEQMKLTTKRLYWPSARRAIEADPDFQTLSPDQQAAILARAEAAYKADTPTVTEDTMPGNLSNIVAGRIANVFDLHGKNFTTDAACASSLAALDAAVEALRKGEADLALSGGSDRSMDITPYVEFSKIGALSPDGSRPFDAGANGFVMGEGCAVFLLKRLEDAERDGDKVYAVLRGVGGSSDGKGKGITAPNPAGQVKAVQRAFEDAELPPATLGLLEAHGTSTPVGDPVELQSLIDAFDGMGGDGATASAPARGSIAVGSVKGNMGHLKSAAGAAGLLKATLAVHHGVLPPTINVQTPNPRIDWAASPFTIQTQQAPWADPAGHPRRAAVSSFGFGGTNFHVVLEGHRPGSLSVASAAAMEAVAPVAGEAAFDQAGYESYMAETGQALEQESLVLAADAAAGAAADLAAASPDARLRDLFHPLTAAGVTAPERVGMAVADVAEIPAKLALAQKAAANPAAARLAFNQGVFLGRGKPEGKVAFLFPGQGTQYVNMGRDLAAKYQVVADTFAEADEILFDELGGIKLTDILWPSPDTPENREASEANLRLTEFTQPAVLTMDVALLRLLEHWGMKPDVVAGHSLGEYGALVAAGVFELGDALHAVAARGREMAHVDLPDLGKMASVTADWPTVEQALAGIDEYVIPANKNCPSQTVIAGSTAGVDAAVAKIQAQGLQVMELPVSAAFHSEIVAPASKPLRKVLGRLDVKPPQVRVLSNVGAADYPTDPEAIRDNLAVQVASPVEWVETIERMYAEGVRTFIEVGPKKALTGFVLDILKAKGDAVAICSNHPKKGGLTHVAELFAFLGAWGLEPKLPALDDPVYTAAFRDPKAAFTTTVASAPAAAPAPVTAAPPPADDGRLATIEKHLSALHAELDAARNGAALPTTAPAPAVAAGDSDLARRVEALGLCLDDIGVSGISVGLPGTKKPLFADDNWDRILAGENLIDVVPEPERAKLAGKNIVRLVKGGDGSAQFQSVKDVAEVIQLAGRRGGFDVADYGVEGDFAATLDKTFQYAIAAGLEALRDAGIPLQRTYLQTSTGSYLPKDWKLPQPLRDETGIIFASAFPGYDNLLDEVSRHLADRYAGATLDELNALYNDLLGVVTDEGARGKLQEAFDAEFARLQDVLPAHGAARYQFNRKFLFSVLSMGHAQLAQFIGARGPNTQVNAACASTTQAIGIAEDWIRTGRCRRVLVVGADDATSDNLFEWIGSGFLASGAATTKTRVEDAALPFDARRHGMIVGMGAVGVLVEAVPETEARAMRPIARLLASKVSNSAFHGSRLDVDHIAGEMQALVAKAARQTGQSAEAMAAATVFMSHETYTPARGGSASAEIHALRATFGAAADQVVIANTKGFTGHPQGAGIEDAIVLKCLQRGQVPPIANFRDPDPELGNLNLSKGGAYDVRYALRLAAGFGSQVAMTFTELVGKEDERVADPAGYEAWVAQVTGQAGATLEVANRTLRVVDQGPPARTAASVAPPTPKPEPAPVAPVPVPIQAPAASGSAVSGEDVLAKLTALVAEQTGYPVDMLEPDLDMEADLGIDTVKQAELFGAIREIYSVPQQDDLQIKDYNTLRKVADYMAERASGGAPAAATEAAPTAPTAEPAPLPAAPPSAAVGPDDVLAKLTAMVAEQTGYPAEMLEPDLDMEADLGIDTVKQAELFGAIRDAYDLPAEEGLQIKDYPTLRAVAGYVAGRLEGAAPAPVAAPAPTPEPVPVPAATAASDDDVLARLTGMVAEQTGYPAEMLEPDLDMEADLGIDTVKQAELFGAIRDAYDLPAEDGLQIKDYPTLRAVAGYISGRLGQAAPVAAPAAPAPVAAPPADAGSDDILATVTALVAEQTGYPAEMLEPDLDLEADLGIDTVKQAELIGQVREHYGIPLIEDLQLSDVATLRAVAGFVEANMGVAATPAGAPPAAPVVEAPAAAAPAPTENASKIVRRSPVVRGASLPAQAREVPRGPVLVVGDPDIPYLDALKAAGFTPSLRETGAEPVGLVILATRPGERAQTRLGAAFEAAKAHAGSLRFALVVTAQDGAHGLEQPHDPAMAAAAGFGKALHKELPDAIVRVVDVHPKFDGGPAAALAELERGDRFEVAYDARGDRRVVDVPIVALPDEVPDVSGMALVVSGGAQGITAELLAALAPQTPRLLLLGRTAQPAEVADWATWDDAAWQAETARAREELLARGEKATPVAITREVDRKRKAVEVHQNLQRLQDLGAEVLYAPVDVTDPEAVTQAVDWARSHWGQIDGVLHAAGMEVSKALADKPRHQFDQVVSVKVDGWNALMAATKDDELRLLAGFTSVAGRFGNLGQTDYSAANEFLAKAVAAEARRRGASVERAFTIAWGPWGELGMATKGSILQVLGAAGVSAIPTADGVAHFLREMAAPGIREALVAGSLGDMDADGQLTDALPSPALGAARDRVAAAPEHFPLVAAVETASDDEVAMTVTMDQARDPYAADHRVDGVPFLPGVFGFEAFAEAAALLAPEEGLRGARGVRFGIPVKQLKEEPAEVTVRASRRDDEPGTISCRLERQARGPNGQPLGNPRVHFAGELLLGVPKARPVTDEVPICTRDLARDQIYPPFFHGPSFQVLAFAGPFDHEEAVGMFRLPEEAPLAAPAGAVFRAQPLVIEALFQVCGLHAMQTADRMCLPAAIDQVDLYEPALPGDEVRLWAQPTGTDEDGLRTYDAAAVTKQGRLLVRLLGFRMVETGPAPKAEPEQAAPAEPTKPATNGATPAPAPAPTPATVELPELDGLAFAAVPVAEAIDATALSFTDAERAHLATLTVPKRAAEWAAGRLAVKEVARRVEPALDPTDIWAEADENGRPHLVIAGNRAPVHLSITHRDGLAIAALSESPLGIDLETIEAKPASFHEEAFNADERAALGRSAQPDVEAVCLWAAKEAAFKQAGTGLAASLREHTVRADGQGGAVVEGPLGTFAVRFYDVAGRVLAVSSPTFASPSASS